MAMQRERVKDHRGVTACELALIGKARPFFPFALPRGERRRGGLFWGHILSRGIIFNSGALTYFISSQDCC